MTLHARRYGGAHGPGELANPLDDGVVSRETQDPGSELPPVPVGEDCAELDRLMQEVGRANLAALRALVRLLREEQS